LGNSKFSVNPVLSLRGLSRTDVRELIPSLVIARNEIPSLVIARNASNDEAIYMTISEQAPQSKSDCHGKIRLAMTESVRLPRQNTPRNDKKLRITCASYGLAMAWLSEDLRETD
jgi:hypothetical protein